ncbi:UBP-type zinc finger domain-containing protein [Streptomyces griseofuscus]|uniref:UBP-type zinc finger domain-containing protein n=1 Tax=Streptomyces griseofuscus TaxID=146922 RepID=UPI0031453E63
MTVWRVRPDGGRPQGRACPHAAAAGPEPAPLSGACLDCVARGRHERRLRLCLTCGHVGCSESSPGAHASAHYESTGHPLVRSMEPGHQWAWCYADELFLEPGGGRGPA